MTPQASRIALNKARDALGKASAAMRVWHLGVSGTLPVTTNYVISGNEAIQSIDLAIAELHAARAALIAEYRRDDDQRAARVDAMLADMQMQVRAGES